jgi:hypothetical protein
VASANPAAPSRGTVSSSNMIPNRPPWDDPTKSHSRQASPGGAAAWPDSRVFSSALVSEASSGMLISSTAKVTSQPAVE